MLLAHKGLWGLEALGHLRGGLEAILLLGLQVSRKCLLILGRATMLGGHMTMGVALLGLERGLGADNSPRSRLVSVRQRLPSGLRVLLLGLLLLLGVARGGVAWALNGHPGLGHKVGIRCHLWGDRVARRRYGWNRLVWRGGVTGNGGLDAIDRGGGPRWGGGSGSGLRRRRLIRRQSGVGWYLRRYVGEGTPGQRPLQGCGELSDPGQQLRRREVGRETGKSNRRSAGPGQGAAAAQVRRGGGQVIRARQTSAGEGGHVRREAAEFLGQVAAQGQDGCAELGQLQVLHGGVWISRFGLQRRLGCCRPRRRLLRSLSVESNKNTSITTSVCSQRVAA